MKNTQSANQRAQKIFDQGKPLDLEAILDLLQKDPEAAAYYILLLQSKAKMRVSPSTPSGMVPPYQKEPAKTKRKKPGRKPGHQGARRKTPSKIDRQEEHRLDQCPDCGSPLQENKKKQRVRTRVIEDIPQNLEPEAVEHHIHRYYCPCCKKAKEPPVPDALPRAAIGNRTLALSAYWHYGLGLTGAQIVDTLNHHLQFTLTQGGLVQMWHRLANIMQPWYEQIVQESRQSAVLHADETGWRVNGITHWLWCFASKQTSLYVIDPSRGDSVPKWFFHEMFQGTLVTDFWQVYDHVRASNRQYCIAHLLREIKKIDDLNGSEEWRKLSKRLKRLLRNALRLRGKNDYTPKKYKSRIERLNKQLLDLATEDYQDKDTKRIAKRVDKYWEDIFTFLDQPEVPATNNHGEQEIRFAVLIRKIIYGNRSTRGACTQSILMSIMRTLKLRGHNPIETIVNSLREYIINNKLPPLPPADG